MVMKRIGAWLAIFAIALQAALPLIASAQPRSVALVPLCTVDGVTHYVEVPTGKTPAGPPPGHGGRLDLCFVGGKARRPQQPRLLPWAKAGAQTSPAALAFVVPRHDFQTSGPPRPPPSL